MNKRRASPPVQIAPPPAVADADLHPDAWERFEAMTKQVMTVKDDTEKTPSPPKERTPR